MAGIKNARIWAAIAVSGFMLTACGMTPQQESDAIENAILETPGAEELWSTIKVEYPQEFAVLVGRVQALDATERQDKANAQEVGAVWLREFFDQITPDAVKAPAEPMLIWSATESELYETLQRSSVEECAKMTMGEWIFVDDGNVAVTSAISRRNAAMVRASAAGRADPQQYTQPDDAAFNTLGDAIAATGIDPELQATIGSDAAMRALSPTEQCEIGVAVYSGLSALPDDVEPQLAAYMLSPQ